MNGAKGLPPAPTAPPDEAAAGYVVAIDGGAATGKTTSAARVAERLGFSYVDSGAIYRTIARALRARGIEDAEDPDIPRWLPQLDVVIDPGGGRFRVILEGQEVGAEIRTPEVAELASRLAVREDIRGTVRALLRAARTRGSLVIEGRDIGTVVFPDATLKIFLVADLHVRAHRRLQDLVAQGIEIDENTVARDLAERDARDSSRPVAPLRQAADALIVDTSRVGIEDQVAQIVAAFRAKVGAGSDAGARESGESTES